MCVNVANDFADTFFVKRKISLNCFFPGWIFFIKRCKKSRDTVLFMSWEGGLYNGFQLPDWLLMSLRLPDY